MTSESATKTCFVPRVAMIGSPKVGGVDRIEMYYCLLLQQELLKLRQGCLFVSAF